MSQPPTMPVAKPESSDGDGGMCVLRFTMRGVSPLLTHSSRLANPLDAVTKEMKRISKKRAKTDADLEYLARLEFLGGLWLQDGEPCIPGEA
jgi:hypothetical protein